MDNKSYGTFVGKFEIEKFQISVDEKSKHKDDSENLFGFIRAHEARNNNPTCNAFQNAFKTSILNNFMSPHSPSSN